MTKRAEYNDRTNGLTGNGRFGAMAVLATQQRQCKLERYYPAKTLVKPPLRQAAGTLGAMRATVRRTKP